MSKSIAPNLWEKVKAFFDQIAVTETGDDKGIIFAEQFSVGAPDNGKESVFGQGDSYPVPIAFHYDIANEVGNVITGATDVTTILESDTGSTVDMFEANTGGQTLLVGSDQPPYGIKAKYFSLGTLEPGNVLAQYRTNLDAWKEEKYMVTESKYPYMRTGWKLASFLSEQIRFGISILNNGSDFGLTTLNINGVDYTKYWARILLVSPITEVPVMEQVKIHTSRTEINSDGVVELFGQARGVKDLITSSYANNLSDPTNENVPYFTGGINGGSAKLVDNEFANNTRDSRLLIVKIDQDVDTSTPLVISYPFYIKGAQTGDVRFDIEYIQITDGFVYGGEVNPDGAFTEIYPITTPSENKRQVLRFEVPINEIDPDVGGVCIVLTRDANEVEDTVAANVVLTGDNAQGRRWRL